MNVVPFRHSTRESSTILAENAVNQLREELSLLGCNRAMLICGGHIARSSLRDRIVNALGAYCAGTFDRLLPHARANAVEQAVAEAIRCRADALVALGGGSAMDSAKGISLLLAEGRPLENHAVQIVNGKAIFRELREPKLPIIAIPTTLSGAELTGGCSITTANGVKLLFRDPKLIPRVVVLDPVANLEVPPEILAPTGINALAHCFEGLYSLARDPISSALSLAAIPMLFNGLPRLRTAPSDVALRSTLLAAANLAGRVTVNARTAVHHAVCHCIGAATEISHGMANTIVLPHAIRFNTHSAAEALLPAGAVLGITTSTISKSEFVETLIHRVQALVAECGLATRLRDLGISRSQLDFIAERTMQEPGLNFNPRPISGKQDVLSILEAAW